MKKIKIVFLILTCFLVFEANIFANGTVEVQTTDLTIEQLKFDLWENLEKNKFDPIEGIYIKYEGSPEIIGIKKNDDHYIIIYYSGTRTNWEPGYICGYLYPTNNPIIFNTTYFRQDTFPPKSDNYITEFKNDMQFELYLDGVIFEGKQIYNRLYPISLGGLRSTGGMGTGFLLNRDGYIITNHHVIKDSVAILVRGNFTELSIEDIPSIAIAYPATVTLTDADNDIAILKIDLQKYVIEQIFENPPYTFRVTDGSLGEDIFTLGYPLVNYSGTDIQLSNGKIGSLSGFRGDKNQYQITVPINPGNSGGPLFDNNGNIVGITTSSLSIAEGIHYAMKINLVEQLIRRSNLNIIMDTNIRNNRVSGRSISEKANLLQKFVYIIEAFK